MRRLGLTLIILLVTCVSCGGPTFHGIKPVSPVFGVSYVAWRNTPLQPTLEWEPLKNHKVTYDVIIYTSNYHTPGREVYYRENLPGPTHKVEEPLEPDTGVVAQLAVEGGCRYNGS